MTERNGKRLSPEPVPPHYTVAERVYDRCMEEGDTPWAELPADQQEAVVEYAAMILSAHVELLMEQGFKIVPPGAAPIPKSQDEALAMVQAAKAFFDGQRRKGKLMVEAQPTLIVPPGRKH